jgi:hypothetical protein
VRVASWTGARWDGGVPRSDGIDSGATFSPGALCSADTNPEGACSILMQPDGSQTMMMMIGVCVGAGFLGAAFATGIPDPGSRPRYATPVMSKKAITTTLRITTGFETDMGFPPQLDTPVEAAGKSP